MSKPVVIHLKNPVYGGGVLTERKILHEKVFTEEEHGKGYRESAREWAVTHAQNVTRIDGLDDESEKQVAVARKKSQA